MTILGVAPLALRRRPVDFVPWKSPRCLEWFDAAAPQVTNPVSGSLYTTTAPSLRGTDVLIGSGTNGGPKLIAGGASGNIGGQPVWQGNGTDRVLQSTTFAFPQIGSTNVYFFYAIMRCDAFTTGFNTMICGGVGTNPLIYISNTTVLSASAGSTQSVAMALGTPKRLVLRTGPQTATDYIQWGAAKTTGNLGGHAAQSGFTLLSRGDVNPATFANGAISACGFFSGEPTLGSLLSQLDHYGSLRWTGWSGLVS